MNNLFVYCEIENNKVADISLELISSGRKLANKLNCKVEVLVFGDNIIDIDKQLAPYGADIIHVADDERLFPFRTLPHAALAIEILKKEKPQIVLLGATSTGRDISPRIASALNCGLTADCTSLDIGDHYVSSEKKEYKNLLLASRPAFGGSIMATIVDWDMFPQMATVREGVMKKEIYDNNHKAVVVNINASKYLNDEHFVVEIIERHIEESKVNLKEASIIVSGGYGVGSKDNFDKLYEFAELIGADVGGSRAAVDAGFIEHDRQIGQTGTTVRPKLYIACGISGAVQHTAGMDESSMIISINTDPNAVINKIADYVIVGDLNEVVPKMIDSYKRNAK